MIDIYPKTLNERIRLSKCLKLQKYVPGLPDEKIKQIYEFLENTKCKVILTPEMLYFINDINETVEAFVLAPYWLEGTYERIELSTYQYKVLTRFRGGTSDGSLSSGCTSCSGCSSNNNNNNNNNNG